MKHFPLPALPGIQQSSGLKIKNGDTVVIECDGKFLSVARGWWMAWTSASPRRSGAFTIEIVERAPQNKFTEHLKASFGSLGAKIAAGARRPTILSKQFTAPITQDNIAQLASSTSTLPSTLSSSLSPSPAGTLNQQVNSQSRILTSNLPTGVISAGVPASGASAACAAIAAAAAQSQVGDDTLYTGDSFRLRSVKFPGYELGITHVKLRDEYCYLGLRKV